MLLTYINKSILGSNNKENSFSNNFENLNCEFESNTKLNKNAQLNHSKNLQNLVFKQKQTHFYRFYCQK